MDNSSSNPTSSNGNDGRKPRLRKKTARGQPSPLHPDNQTKSDASNSTVPMTQKRSSAGNLKDPAGSSRSSQLRPRQPSQDHSSKPTPQPLSPNLISSPSPTSTSAPHSSVNQPARGRPLPSIPNAVPVSQPSNIAAVGDEITAESSQQTFENIPWSPSNAEFGHSDTASTSNPSQQPPNKPVRRQRSLIRPERQPHFGHLLFYLPQWVG
ncbi:hypothetical protein BKA69DRAFT_1062517 [Paraphysoderma sedebokerense]|nr:hypothetical protein BKA69DRAFT_1062517 [Paraphysoderma sedebokerense]